MNEPNLIYKEAKKRLRAIRKDMQDLRYRRTIGFFKKHGFLFINRPYPYLGRPDLPDVIWAGRIEPRIYELLPAILLKRPRLIRTTVLPDPIKQILQDIRKGHPTKPFYGIPAAQYMQWVTEIGHKHKSPTLLKTFRFQQNDIKLLKTITEKSGITEIEAIRKGLKLLSGK